MTVLLADLTRDLLAAPRPVLFLDACAVIDVVRFARPDREVPVGVVEAAQRLVSASRAGRVALVGSELLKIEVDDHLDEERRGAAKELARASARMAVILAGVDIRVGPGNASAWWAVERNLLMLPDELARLVHDLMREVTLVRDDPACIEHARIRAVCHYPPSHKKESRKDCEVFEHCLDLSRRLARHGHPHPRVLVTSNKTDFDPGLLKEDLLANQVKLVSTLFDAWGAIGRP